MNHDLMKNRELISALADGQLRGADFARTVELTAVDDDAQLSWELYHMLGDILRAPDLARASSDSAFMARLSANLVGECAGVSGSVPAVVTFAVAVEEANVHNVAANDPDIRWKLVAGFASVAAVAAIGWGTLSASGSLQPAHPQLAQAAVVAPAAATEPTQVARQVTVAGTQQVMIRDAHLDELMSAHRQFGGTSALQMPAGFLRNATFEGPTR